MKSPISLNKIGDFRADTDEKILRKNCWALFDGEDDFEKALLKTPEIREADIVNTDLDREKIGKERGIGKATQPIASVFTPVWPTTIHRQYPLGISRYIPWHLVSYAGRALEAYTNLVVPLLSFSLDTPTQSLCLCLCLSSLNHLMVFQRPSSIPSSIPDLDFCLDLFPTLRCVLPFILFHHLPCILSLSFCFSFSLFPFVPTSQF